MAYFLSYKWGYGPIVIDHLRKFVVDKPLDHSFGMLALCPAVAKTRVRVRPRVTVRVGIRIQKVSKKCIKANLKLLFRPN